MIYISTSTLGVKSTDQLLNINVPVRYGIEFSSLFSFFEPELVALKNKFILHNYTPPPRERDDAFLLNLSGSIRDLRLAEMMVTSNLLLSARFGIEFYGIHAGFSPHVSHSMLGGDLPETGELKSWTGDYITHFRRLAATTPYTRLLFENNVLSARNKHRRKQLMAVTPDEICALNMDLGGGKNLLLDLAHLKVSSVTCNFDIYSALEKLLPLTSWLHVSENDGLEDLNEIFDGTTWFIPLLRDFKNINITIETRPADQAELECMIEALEAL